MHTLQRFHESFDRCVARPGFLEAFYERFMETSDEVRVKFADTRFDRQIGLLRASLHLVSLLAAPPDEVVGEFERIARRHSQAELDIRPELYEVWLDCLVDTVEEFDAAFSDEVARAWRDALRPGIEFMIARYSR